MSNNYVLEIAVFTVKEEYIIKIPAIRDDFHKTLKYFSGLIELATFSPLDNSKTFADIVKWKTMEDAIAVAEAFERGDKRFLPYVETIE